MKSFCYCSRPEDSLSWPRIRTEYLYRDKFTCGVKGGGKQLGIASWQGNAGDYDHGGPQSSVHNDA